MPRARGYHYVRGANGRKRRVYSKGRSTRSSYPRRRTAFASVYGRGAYYSKRRRAQSGRQLANTPNYMGSRRQGAGLALVFNGTDPPKISGSRSGFTISHREYIQDITSSTPFIPENFALNPGIQTTFPWLSQIADNFEEWIPEGILFEFKTTSSNMVVNAANSNPGLGAVIIATQYNSLNNQFGNKQQMENYQDAVSVDPSRSVMHPVECAKAQTPLTPLFVRSGALPTTTTQDLRFYDLGVTTVATVGQQTNNFVIGELWISYKIRFLKPRLQTGRGNNEDGNVDHFQLIANSVALQSTAGILPATPFGTQTSLVVPLQGSTLGGVISGGITPVASQFNIQFPSSLGGTKPFPIFAIAGSVVQPTQIPSVANTYYFPAGITSGLYMVTYTGTFTNSGVPANLVPVALDATNGCHITAKIGTVGLTTAGVWINTSTANTRSIVAVWFLTVTSNYANFSLTGTAGITTPIDVDVIVMQMPAAFT